MPLLMNETVTKRRTRKHWLPFISQQSHYKLFLLCLMCAVYAFMWINYFWICSWRNFDIWFCYWRPLDGARVDLVFLFFFTANHQSAADTTDNSQSFADVQCTLTFRVRSIFSIKGLIRLSLYSLFLHLVCYCRESPTCCVAVFKLLHIKIAPILLFWSS